MEKPRTAWLLHQLLVLHQRVALYGVLFGDHKKTRAPKRSRLQKPTNQQCANQA